MIKTAIFTNRFGRSLRCALGAPGSTCLAISSIDGLGPGMASVTIHDIPTIDGGYFGSARYGSRNIVVNFSFLEFDADGQYVSVEKTRHMGYSFFQPKTPIQVLVESEERILVIVGYIEKCEPVIFSSAETMQVSILCPGYYFKMVSNGDDLLSARLYSAGLFQFPFANESLTMRLLEFGNVSSTEIYNLLYNGDAENGFTLEIGFTGNEVTGQIFIANTPKGNTDLGNVGFGDDTPQDILNWSDQSLVENYIEIDMATLASRLSARYSDPIYTNGNRIVIRTEAGKKTAKLVTIGGDEFNILGYFPHLEWLKLYPGYNQFEIKCNNASIGHFNVTARYEALYTGV